MVMDEEERSAIAVHHTATSEAAWDGPATQAAIPNTEGAASFKAMAAWNDPGMDPDTKAAYKFWHHFWDGNPGAASTVSASAGIAVLNGGRGGTTIPDSDRQGVYNHLVAHLKDANGADYTPPPLRDLEPEGEQMNAHPPRDNLVRAMPGGLEVRYVAEAAMPTMTGHFAVFNQWTRIDSMMEGTFMERIAPGAFSKTFSEQRDSMRVLFQHGKDPHIGNKVLGPIASIEEDSTGALYDVPLLDTSYNRDLIPGLEANLYGSSFRFRVLREDVVAKPKRSAANPDGIPERTIREAQVFEFGPVTFPAYAGATAGLRSMTDEFTLKDFTRDPARLSAMASYVEPADGLEEPAPTAPSVDAGAEPHLEAERRVDDPSTPTPTENKAMEYVTRDEKAARVSELREELKRMAVEFPGVLPDEEQARWDADEAEMQTLERDIAAWDSRQAKIRAFSEDPAKTEAPAVIVRDHIDDIYDLGKVRSQFGFGEEATRKVRKNALRAIESAAPRMPKKGDELDGLVDIIEHRDEGEEGKGEAAQRVLLTGSPAYRRAFNKYLKNQQALWSPEEARAAALAVTGTTTTGGYAVPYIFDPTLLHIGAFTAVNPFRAACRVVTITNGNNWLQPTVGAITAAYGAEAAEATEGGPTFGQPSYTVQTASAFASLSIETLQDRPDITGELTSLFAEAKDTLEENKFAVGAAANQDPLGMFANAAYTNQDTVGDNATAITDLTLAESKLALRHRVNAAFFMSRSTIRQLQALDTTGYYFKSPGQFFAAGNPALSQSRVGNTGLQCLGYPVWEVPSAVSTLTTDGAIIVVIAAPKSYVIVDRLGMNVEVIPQLFGAAQGNLPSLQRGVLCYWRNTAKPIDATAGISLSVQ